jgi:hypothetical protein
VVCQLLRVLQLGCLPVRAPSIMPQHVLRWRGARKGRRGEVARERWMRCPHGRNVDRLLTNVDKLLTNFETLLMNFKMLLTNADMLLMNVDMLLTILTRN